MKAQTHQDFKMHMQKRNFHRLSSVKRGSEIICDRGVLWITQAGDLRDYVLRAGDKMTVTKRGKVLVEAMREADLHVL